MFQINSIHYAVTDVRDTDLLLSLTQCICPHPSL